MEVEQAEVADDGGEALDDVGVAGAGEAPAAALLDGTTHAQNSRLAGQAGPVGQGVEEGEVGGTVQHDAERPVFVVLDHEHDGAVEVRVSEHRLGDEQATCGRRHRSSLALTRPRRAHGGAMLPAGPYDVIVVDAESSDTRRVGAGVVCTFQFRGSAFQYK